MSDSWPPTNTVPTAESPHFLATELVRGNVLGVTPKGVVYGEQHMVAMVPHKIWWTGTEYRYVETVDEVMEPEELPAGPRPFGEMWAVRTYDPAKNAYYWAEWWWDAEAGLWKRLRWLWTIDGFAALPKPGLQKGCAHIVIQRDVLTYFDGEQFRPFPHSNLDDDEPLRHLPNGFLESAPPDVRLQFYSPTEIALEAVPGGTGKVLVNGEYVTASRDASVFPSLPVLQWDEDASTITPVYIEPAMEYVIFVANSDTAFSVGALPGDATHAATPAWDFRNKLFLSTNTDINGYLGRSGTGKNARRAGKIRIDSTPATEGGPYFLNEIDISDLSRQVILPETYRDYSDFTVVFVDQDRLALEKIDGMAGYIYVGGNLQKLGSGYELSRTDPWIEWKEAAGATSVVQHTEALSVSSLYYIYLAGDVDPYNFNDLNPETNRPWQGTDDDATGYYDAVKDMRLCVFLSPKVPDHALLSGSWPGYAARHIGQVATDANGRFVNARDLSAIRQPTLNPVYFDGLAECQLEKVSDSELRLVKKLATSGIINVAGEAVQTYERLELEQVQRVYNTDVVQLYTEANLAGPLSDLNALNTFTGQTVYLYIANKRQHWGSLAGKTFWALTAPKKGYLSGNWPGNQARWLATVKMSPTGTFGQNFLVDSVSPLVPVIDDGSNSPNTTLSSAFIRSELAKLQAQLNAQTVYENQKAVGCSVVLQYVDETHVRLQPASSEAAILITKDLTMVEVPLEGISTELSGLGCGRIYNVYLTPTGLVINEDAPTSEYANLAIYGDMAILVGWLTCGAYPNVMDGAWNVVSFWNEPDSEWNFIIPPVADVGAEVVRGGLSDYDYAVSMPGFIASSRVVVEMQRTGQDSAKSVYREDPDFFPHAVTPLNSWGKTEVFSQDVLCWSIESSDATAHLDITNAFVLRRTYWAIDYHGQYSMTYLSTTGSIVITRRRAT